MTIYIIYRCVCVFFFFLVCVVCLLMVVCTCVNVKSPQQVTSCHSPPYLLDMISYSSWSSLIVWSQLVSEFRDPHVSPSPAVGLQVCPTMPGFSRGYRRLHSIQDCTIDILPTDPYLQSIILWNVHVYLQKGLIISLPTAYWEEFTKTADTCIKWFAMGIWILNL